MIWQEKWMIFTPLQKLPNNVGDLGKIIVASGFEWLPKVQKITQSGHTDLRPHVARRILKTNNWVAGGEVVVAQLVEWSLLLPEVCGSNPVIGKIYIEHLFTCLLSTVL